MAQDCPFDPDIHVKRKIEPAKGMSLWFADVPEGGITENTYLSACASSGRVFGPSGDFVNTHFRLIFRSVTSEEGSKFYVEPHFHPKSTEYFKILDGRAHFTLDGKEYIVERGDNFVIPRGVVHTVSSPESEHMKFKVRGGHDPVAERDFLIQMFALVETVSVHEPRLTVNCSRLIVFNTTFRTSLDC